MARAMLGRIAPSSIKSRDRSSAIAELVALGSSRYRSIQTRQDERKVWEPKRRIRFPYPAVSRQNMLDKLSVEIVEIREGLSPSIEVQATAW
jgi:hypothetical protein